MAQMHRNYDELTDLLMELMTDEEYEEMDRLSVDGDFAAFVQRGQQIMDRLLAEVSQ